MNHFVMAKVEPTQFTNGIEEKLKEIELKLDEIHIKLLYCWKNGYARGRGVCEPLGYLHNSAKTRLTLEEDYQKLRKLVEMGILEGQGKSETQIGHFMPTELGKAYINRLPRNNHKNNNHRKYNSLH